MSLVQFKMNDAGLQSGSYSILSLPCINAQHIVAKPRTPSHTGQRKMAPSANSGQGSQGGASYSVEINVFFFFFWSGRSQPSSICCEICLLLHASRIGRHQSRTRPRRGPGRRVLTNPAGGDPIRLRKGLEGGQRSRRIPSIRKAERAIGSATDESMGCEYDV